MTLNTWKFVAVVAVAATLTGCHTPSGSSAESSHSAPATAVNTAQGSASRGIQAIPEVLSSYRDHGFVSYLPYRTPNGGSIHIVAQNQITDDQMVRSHNILAHYLNSYNAVNKDAIANNMAKNGATLTLLNGRDTGNPPQVTGQPLYFEEIQVEGGDWYMNQNYEHRDAAFEEILHLVHDYGIGVDGEGGLPGAAPEYQQRVRAAQEQAVATGVWPLGDGAAMISEWTAENSMTQEYMASVIDAYYGLWGAFGEVKDASMWGIYAPRDRVELPKEDPMGNAVAREFFSPTLTYTAELSAQLSGDFSLRFDPVLPYTHHSRYLTKVKVQGTSPTTIILNNYDNTVVGAGASTSVKVSGATRDYEVSKSGEEWVISDLRTSGDGTNTLRHVSQIIFTDGTRKLDV